MIDIYSVEDDLEIGVIYIDSITHTRTACLYQRKVSWVMKFSDERLHPEVHLGHMRAKSEDRLIPRSDAQPKLVYHPPSRYFA